MAPGPTGIYPMRTARRAPNFRFIEAVPDNLVQNHLFTQCRMKDHFPHRWRKDRLLHGDEVKYREIRKEVAADSVQKSHLQLRKDCRISSISACRGGWQVFPV